MARKRVEMSVRFWAKVQKTESCWLWMGAISNKTGHGRLGRGARSEGLAYAHIYSWELHNGPVPAGLFVCHNCPVENNGRCVNPAHLYIGTAGDNVRDAHRRGEFPGRKGEDSSRARLTETHVHQIRVLLSCGHSAQSIAREYGVTTGPIYGIKKNQIWRHI